MKSKRQGLIILGSTGSIGKSTLSVVDANQDRFRVDGLSCRNSVEILAEQVRKYSPRMVATGEGKSEQLRQILGEKAKTLTILEGREGFMSLARLPQSDKIVAAFVGAAGIEPVLTGIRAKKTIALANKESMVMAGSLLLKEAKQHAVQILPIDSEHNAVFQSLYGEKRKHLEYITLTASGGPFRSREKSDFNSITVEEALNHPNWSMGKKITVDSATMMNKCLEIIEAKWLFDIEPERIKVVIHPQSIVHSMVTFKDASTICQMGTPDMRIPIANCLGYPERINSASRFLNLTEVSPLTFEKPDHDKFPTIRLAYDVLRLGGGAPAALNGANEVLVELFLNEKIPFIRIFQALKELVSVIEKLHKSGEIASLKFLQQNQSIEQALAADHWGRSFVLDHI